MTAVGGDDPRVWRREARAFFELFAVCGLAITQPLLDLFGRGVEQFALRGASPPQIVLFAAAVTVLPAAGLWLGEAAVGLVSQPARRWVHLAVLVVLVAAVVVQAARPLVTGPALALVAVAAGAVAAVGYRRAPVVRLWLAFAAAGPLLFLGFFLVGSPTADLLNDDTEASDVDIGSPAPVVMVVLDELPLESLLRTDGTIDAELFPNLARLAGDSHWFRNTTTVTSTTWHAVPAILTGQLPEDHGGPVAASHPDNLFTLLGGRYEMRVTETISRMCPAAICSPTAASTDVWRGLAGDALRVMRSRLSLTRGADDPVTGFADLSAPEAADEPVFADLDISQPDRFRALIDGLDGDDLALHYLHILLPHVPYRYLPSGNVYDGPIPDLGRIVELDQWGDEAWPVTLGRQRHLLQLGYVDRLIGVLLDELDAKGLYDDALVVLTADHGISFQPGGAIRAIEGQVLDEHSTPDILWVPLFVKEPGQTEGDTSDANVLSIDVLPTMADVLDIDVPFHVDGRSALGPPRPTTDKPYYGNNVTPLGVAVADPVTIDGPTGWAAVLERSVGAFLTALDDPRRMWRIGPSPALVGESVDSVPAGRLVAVDAALLAPDAFTSVAASGTKPALVRGRVEGIAAGTPLVIAINGVIAATGPAYTEDGQVVFAVMVDEASLRTGANDVRVYEVR